MLREAVISVLPRRTLAFAVCAVYPRVESELAQLGDYMPRGGTAVDVGAWFGPWSRRMTRYADRVVAIEAHPELAALLKRSVPSIEVINAAASAELGHITLMVPPGGGASMGISSVEHGAGEPVPVPTVTIDSLSLTDVRFIKMDIEGHELAALHGGQKTIARDRPMLLLELEDRMQPVDRVVDLLTSWGYEAFVRPGKHWISLAQFDLITHQRATISRVHQSFLRRLVWPRPRYVNMVLFKDHRTAPD